MKMASGGPARRKGPPPSEILPGLNSVCRRRTSASVPPAKWLAKQQWLDQAYYPVKNASRPAFEKSRQWRLAWFLLILVF